MAVQTNMFQPPGKSMLRVRCVLHSEGLLVNCSTTAPATAKLHVPSTVRENIV